MFGRRVDASCDRDFNEDPLPQAHDPASNDIRTDQAQKIRENERGDDSKPWYGALEKPGEILTQETVQEAENKLQNQNGENKGK